METTLSKTDKKIIRDLVSAYPAGERSRHIRSIFGLSTTTEHFIYLGYVIGTNMRDQSQQVHKLRILSYLN